MAFHRFLLVEDDPDTCELLKIFFNEDEVTCVFGYEHALDRIRTDGLYDLYLLDYYLPDHDGIELCEAIRKHDQRAPIVFLTGSQSLQNADVKAAGPQYLVRKSRPDFLEDLKSHIDLLLGSGSDVGAYWLES